MTTTILMTIFIIFFMVGLCVSNKASVAIATMLAVILMFIFKIINFDEAFLGFANNITITYIGMSIIGCSLIEVGIIDDICNLFAKKIVKNEKRFISVIIIITALMSIFISNKLVVLLMIELITYLEQKTKGKIKKKVVLLPLVMATGVGGLTMVPTTSALLAAQGILEGSNYNGFSIFEFSIFVIPLLISLLLYFNLFGYKLSKKLFKNEKYEETEQEIVIKTKNIPLYKKVVTILILCGCIIGFLLPGVKSGIVAIICGVLCIITRCVKEKTAFKSINWSVIFVLAGSLAISQGIINSGLSTFIADELFLIIDAKMPLLLVVGIILLITIIISNFLASVSVVTILAPIGISLAEKFNFDIKYIVMAIALGALLTFIMPTGNTRTAMAMEEGKYKITDAIKIAGIYTIISYIVVMIVFAIKIYI